MWSVVKVRAWLLAVGPRISRRIIRQIPQSQKKRGEKTGNRRHEAINRVLLPAPEPSIDATVADSNAWVPCGLSQLLWRPFRLAQDPFLREAMQGGIMKGRSQGWWADCQICMMQDHEATTRIVDARV